MRNLATVCGNVAHADPANDHPAVMLAYRAEVVAEGPNGRRTIPIDDFFVDTFVTALEPDEVLVELRIPAPTPGSGGAYQKLERKVGDYAIAGVAVQLQTNAAGEVTQAGIGLTNVGPMPIRAVDAENALVGRVPDDEAISTRGRSRRRRDRSGGRPARPGGVQARRHPHPDRRGRCAPRSRAPART